MILVSACLCGVNCKYNGKNNLNSKVLELFKQGKAVLICPEQLGGQSTPRSAHEIKDGTGLDVLEGKARVVGVEGEDSTAKFLRGAEETLHIAKECSANIAILKANSPSCGYGTIYDGSFNGIKRAGNGVTAELLSKNGIKVCTEENFEDILNL